MLPDRLCEAIYIALLCLRCYLLVPRLESVLAELLLDEPSRQVPQVGSEAHILRLLGLVSPLGRVREVGSVEFLLNDLGVGGGVAVEGEVESQRLIAERALQRRRSSIAGVVLVTKGAQKDWLDSHARIGSLLNRTTGEVVEGSEDLTEEPRVAAFPALLHVRVHLRW